VRHPPFKDKTEELTTGGTEGTGNGSGSGWPTFAQFAKVGLAEVHASHCFG
jgi:hypothetical protein